MSNPTRGRPGKIYAGLLTVLIVAVVGVAASALYISAGGEIAGVTGGMFGIDARPDSATLILRRAREAAWKGDYPRSLAGLDSLLDARPGDRALAIERARVLGWAERFGEAADALAAVEDSTDVETSLERARFLWWAGRSTEADSLLSEILALHPEAREARQLQDLVRPSVEPAVGVAERWVRERPEDPASHLWLARALVEEGREAEALAHYRAAFGEPGAAEPEVLLEAAGVALGADSLHFAAETLARYLNDVDPADRATRLRLARAYAWAARWDDAVAQYRRVLDAEPDPAVRLELARTLAGAGRFPAAAAEYRLLLADDPAPATRRELAGVLARAGRHAEAVAQLDRLIRERGEDRDRLERARVLALAERYGEAADALAPFVARSPDDDALRLRQARWLWWAGRMPEADAALTAILTRTPGHDEARALREEVRAGIDPSPEQARAWVALDDTPENRLRLARALVKAERPGEALEHFRAALPPRADAERLVEVLEAAEAADSLQAAIALLEARVAIGTADPDFLLRLARLHSWAGQPDRAIDAYGDYLRIRPEDREARFERGRELAWQDSTRWAEAGSELERVVAADSAHAGAHKLLGDLSRWRGDAAAALDHYARAAALDPSLDGLDEGIRLATGMKEAEATPPDATFVAWATEADAYSDSEGFDWAAARARYHWRVGNSTVAIVLGQGRSAGRTLLGADMDAWGVTTGLDARVPLDGRWTALLEAGVVSFQDVDAIATWGAGIEFEDSLSSATLRYRREPGVREAATMAALRAGTVLDRVQLSAMTRRGAWSGAADLQAQRFGADAGDATRFAGMARVQRELGAGLSAGAMIRAIAADAAAPVLADVGPLYWTPAHYIAPALTVGWARPLGSDWWVGLRAAPGYAWIDEREDGAVRYEDGSTPILETGATVGWRRGRWSVDLSGDWGGNLQSDGYHAAGLGLTITRSGGSR